MARTNEQIMKDLEKRYAELEQTAITKATSCENCRFCYEDNFCKNPLVKGYTNRVRTWDYVQDMRTNPEMHIAALCGPERALFEPKPWHKSETFNTIMAILSILLVVGILVGILMIGHWLIGSWTVVIGIATLIAFLLFNQ